MGILRAHSAATGCNGLTGGREGLVAFSHFIHANLHDELISTAAQNNAQQASSVHPSLPPTDSCSGTVVKRKRDMQ